jgi:integrase/recombinase XerD
VYATWKLLVASAELKARSAARRPRKHHDVRHSFAVDSLLDSYTAGQDGQARLALLSTYMGHVDADHSY